MKPKLLILMCCLPYITWGQSKIVEKNTAEGRVKYLALKSDKNFKAGLYEVYHAYENIPSITGYYKNNKKDSLWQFFSGTALVSKGYYKDGQKTGIWTGYTSGFERLKYDPVKNEVILYIPARADSAWSFTVTGQPEKTVLDRIPICINGPNSIAYLLMREIRYPAAARQANKQGQLRVSFIIDEEGQASNYKVSNKLGYGIDEEVLRAVQTIPGDWVPAMLNGKKVAVQSELLFSFEINPEESRPHQPGTIIIVAVSGNYRPN